jgi:acetyltransferase-like isoleucine patch superfamily enzyme
MKIYIIGAGTLCKFIIDIAESRGDIEIGGIFDDNFPALKNIYTYSVIGKLSDININFVTNLAIGIGDTRWRKRIFEERSAQGFVFPTLIHGNVVLSKHCFVDRGVIIGPNSSVLSGSNIGRAACILSHVNVNQDVTIGPYSLIGAGVVIGNNAVLGEGSHIGMSSHVKLNQRVESWGICSDPDFSRPNE